MINSQQRLFTVILVISFALNLFLGGALLGSYLFRPPPPHHPPRHGMPLKWVLEVLPKESHHKVISLLDKHNPIVHAKLEELRHTHETVRNLLGAESFDITTFNNTLAQLHQAMTAMQTPIQDAIVEIASQLNREERQKLAEGMLRRH